MMEDSLLPNMPRDMTSEYRVDARNGLVVQNDMLDDSDESIEEFTTDLTPLT